MHLKFENDFHQLLKLYIVSKIERKIENSMRGKDQVVEFVLRVKVGISDVRKGSV